MLPVPSMPVSWNRLSSLAAVGYFGSRIDNRRLPSHVNKTGGRFHTGCWLSSGSSFSDVARLNGFQCSTNGYLRIIKVD
jgi:hypothetical protein